MKKFSRINFIILYEKQEGKCAYCGCSLLEEAKKNKNPQIDHINPKSKNGDNKIENFCLVCGWCNMAKRDKSKEEFLNYLRPYFEKKVNKKDLREYNIFLKLSQKFKENNEGRKNKI